MSNVQVKHHDQHKHGNKVQPNKKTDILFFIAAVVAVVLALVFMPKLLAATDVSFLAVNSGLNKLFSVVVAVIVGWVALLPSQSYKNFITLAKGARIEWRKTVKPDRDTVMKTTMMVLALVIVFALMILILDWLFGSILREFVN
ncbi:MAG: preprotein translocase subunit SecE [Ostreibacterium sp.]